MSFTRKYLSADGLHKTVKHSLLREQFKEMDSEYTWQDCIMSGLAVFGFKFPWYRIHRSILNAMTNLMADLAAYTINTLNLSALKSFEKQQPVIACQSLKS